MLRLIVPFTLSALTTTRLANVHRSFILLKYYLPQGARHSYARPREFCLY